jgi:integrase
LGLSLMRPPQTHRLPVVLSRDEVWRILHLVRLPIYRVCLITIYACGLRLLEGARLQVSHVDGARLLVHVTGKGQYDRYVPLPQTTLTLMRPLRAIETPRDPRQTALPLERVLSSTRLFVAAQRGKKSLLVRRFQSEAEDPHG